MNPGVIALIIPILIFMIPIIAILTAHQQKMAQLLHGSQRNSNQDAEIAALREEMRALREMVTSQTLMLESIHSRNELSNDLRDRVRTNA